jgi:hypothetical protein
LKKSYHHHFIIKLIFFPFNSKRSHLSLEPIFLSSSSSPPLSTLSELELSLSRFLP